MNIRQSISKAFHTAMAAVLVIAALTTSLPAQRPSNSNPRRAAEKVPPKAGWSGIITFRKTLQDSLHTDEKLFGRVDDSERIKHDQTRNYLYQGQLLVNDLAGTGRATTRATVSLRDSDFHKVTQNESTNCHNFEPSRMIKSENIDKKVTEGNATGEAPSYSISTIGDTFRLSFSLPEFEAKYTHTESTTYSNLCANSTRKPSNSSKSSMTRVPQGGSSVEGKIDPKTPDILEGSKTWTEGTAKIKGFTYTITWRLRRKPQPLMITDIRFFQPIYPSPSDWQEIPDKLFAVDGNQVKVIATVVNLASTDKTATVNFRELKENTDLPNGSVTATIPANGQKDVEMIWDTSGYAWQRSGDSPVPETARLVEAKIPDDSMQKGLTVVPKPVILVWGFWQAGDAMRKFHSYLNAVSDKWASSDGMTDVRKVSTDNANDLDSTIRKMQRRMNAWHVDLVSVQNGGLTARVYVNSIMPTAFDGRPTATHLVMVGVPNLGTPCASGLMGLSFKLNTLNWNAVAELSEESMKRFNLLVNNTNGTRFAALAVRTRNSVCMEDTPGDGFATIPSAIWRTKVNAVMRAQVPTRAIMGEVAHFRQILKWIAIPPKGDHSPDPSTLNAVTPFRSEAYFKMASFSGSNGDERKPDHSAVVLLKPNTPAAMNMRLPATSRISVVFMAPPGVTATLVNERGETIGVDQAGSEASEDVFRTITVKGNYPAGQWSLRFEGSVGGDIEIPVTVWLGEQGGDKRDLVG